MEIRALSNLRQLAAPRFRLRPFELVPLEFEEDVLVLEDAIPAAQDSKVVPIFGGSSPTELRDRIERHLDTQAEQQAKSATDELAEALAELRRSLR
jgi:hypothetical protein